MTARGATLNEIYAQALQYESDLLAVAAASGLPTYLQLEDEAMGGVVDDDQEYTKLYGRLAQDLTKRFFEPMKAKQEEQSTAVTTLVSSIPGLTQQLKELTQSEGGGRRRPFSRQSPPPGCGARPKPKTLKPVVPKVNPVGGDQEARVVQAAVLTDVASAAPTGGAPANPDPDPLYEGRTGENTGPVGPLTTSRETAPSVSRSRSNELTSASSLPQHTFTLPSCPDSTVHPTEGIKGNDETQVGSGLVRRPPPSDPQHYSPEGGCGSRAEGEDEEAVEDQGSDMWYTTVAQVLEDGCSDSCTLMGAFLGEQHLLILAEVKGREDKTRSLCPMAATGGVCVVRACTSLV